MIYDRLENFSRYVALAPETWEKIADFFRTLSAETAPGRYELEKDRIFVNVNDLCTHEILPGKLEYHEQYADIQLTAAGCEKVLCGALGGAETTPFSEEKDCGFKKLLKTDFTAELYPGVFLLLFPGEGHMPDVGDGNPVRKVVVKVHRDCFSGAKR